MMRAFYITAMVLTIGFIFADIYYIDEASRARYSQYDSMYSNANSYGYSNYSSYNEGDDVTTEAGFVTMAFFLVYTILFILSLIKIKKTTIKVFSIIGLSLTGIMILWDGVMISSPDSISFDEVGAGWIAFGLTMMAFMIVGTIQAFKAKA